MDLLFLDIGSHFDGIINEESVTKMRNIPGARATWYAWDFLAEITFSKGNFHAEIFQYGDKVETMTGVNFADLKNSMCEKYGYN